jgi:two-component system sensor kinase FixL
VGAMSHEIRNIAAAISLVQKNIAAQSPGVAATVDFESLQQLTATLERMSSVELSQVKRNATKLNLQLCLEEFRILAQSALREQEIHFEWIVPDDLPTVWADQQSMMQVFLNLLRNSQAALENIADPVLTVKVITTPENLQIHVIDNGPGVASPAELFHPFDKPGAAGGFGLYLSKALVNSFRGNLRYQQSNAGATFIIDLQVHP